MQFQAKVHLELPFKLDLSGMAQRERFLRDDWFWVKEPETLKWIESFEKNTIFWDVGANIGVYSLYSAVLCSASMCYAFVGRLGDMWVGDDVKIDSKVRIIGPVVIGEGSSIEKNCVLGKNTVIGANGHLETNSTIKGSVIFPDSIIKEGSYLKDCIVNSDCTIERGSFIERGAILGSHVHLGSYSRVRSKRSIFNSTVILPESIVDSDYSIVA